MTTTRLQIEYDGTSFNGWAIQPRLRTVQGELEHALTVLRGEPVSLVVAGRTDVGVHAWGQVASYDGAPVDLKSLNGLVGHDLAVVACDTAANGFSARHDAVARTYCYRVFNREQPSPFLRNRALHVRAELDREALDECASALVGSHDFTAFTPTETEHTRFVREVLRAEWVDEGELLSFWIEARSFLRNMNRALVGTMLDVAKGKRGMDEFRALLTGVPRTEAGHTAAACGLALARVRYPDEPEAALYLLGVLRVLLTNDDGIDAEGLQELRRELVNVEGVDLVTIAPDGNRSAIGRGITTRRPLVVERVDFDDGSHGFATDGTPVDCVRLASLGLVDDWHPELVVAGINHGANLGDDVTYSGTVAAAMEGLVLGLPAIAVSQQSMSREMDFRLGYRYEFGVAARFVARLVAELEVVRLPASTLLNVNVPADEPSGVEVTRLGKRIYRDQLKLDSELSEQRRRYWIYGADPGFEDDEGTDLAAVHAGRIAVTPIHMDLTHHDGIGALSESDLDRLLAPALDG